MSARGRWTKREGDGEREANNAAHKQAGRGTDRLTDSVQAGSKGIAIGTRSETRHTETWANQMFLTRRTLPRGTTQKRRTSAIMQNYIHIHMKVYVCVCVCATGHAENC